MSVEYEAIFQIDLGSAIKEVGDLMNGINSHLSTAGCDEKLKALTEVQCLSVTVDRELTEEEHYKMKCLLEAAMVKAIPQYDIRLKSFGRKSGNVQQSAS